MRSAALQKLVAQYLTDDLSEKDQEHLIRKILAPENRAELENIMREQYGKNVFAGEEDKALREKIFNKIQSLQEVELPAAGLAHPPAKQVFFGRKAWIRSAAAIILLAGGAVYLWLSNPAKKELAYAYKQVSTEIVPGSNKAVLTLADGSTILLDSAAKGNLALQGGTRIVKPDDGQLLYESEGGMTTGDNIISIPRGGHYQVSLPDGSKVWLNSASSIRFPTVFSGASRIVTVQGEVYMEIAPDTKKPFIVRVNDMKVRVLGTSFNINAYPDEKEIRTTLLGGRVAVGYGEKDMLLSLPGQQARANNGEIAMVNDVNTDQVLGWKNNLFYFNEDGIDVIMRQLSRWYDVEIKYEENIPALRLSGKIQRSLPLSEVLEGLGGMELHFRLEGRTLIVMP